MSQDFQTILNQCDRLSADEQLALIQALAEKLKQPISQRSQQPGSTPQSTPSATTPERYQPKNAKDYINHLR